MSKISKILEACEAFYKIIKSAGKNTDYFNKYKKLLYEIQDKNLSRKEEELEEKELVISILNEMLQDPKFDKIFKTEKGSVYFLDEDSECLRLKQEGEKLKFQPITKDLFFIDEAGLLYMKSLLNEDKFALKYTELDILSGRSSERLFVPLKKYEVGAFPLELNVKEICIRDKMDRLIKFEVVDDKLVFYATPRDETKAPSSEDDFYDNFFGGIHFGHRITEIIK